jgi:PEP-CTERM motif
MYSRRTFAIAALWVAGSLSSVIPAIAQDDVFVAQDGVNTGSIGAYSISFCSDSVSGSVINSSLITSPAAGQSTEVRMSLATDGLGDLFVGEYSGGSTATIGEYSLNGTAINSSFLTLSDRTGVPQLAADGQGHLFVSVGDTVSEYTTGGTLLNSFSLALGPSGITIAALAVDSSDDVYAAYTIDHLLPGGTYSGVIGESTASGSPIGGRPLITTPNFINGLTVGGGDIYVSIQDGPPDIENRIDEYTTGGSLVMSPFISGVGGHTALDGQGNLLVDSYGDGTISAYTTSGTLLGSDVITGAGGAEDMVIIPVPEPSAFALLAVGALGLLARRS